jgi:hypothetical protein
MSSRVCFGASAFTSTLPRITIISSKMRFVLEALAVASVCAVVGAASVAQADIIAEWNFEPVAFLADSSGNGHDLTQIGTVVSDTTDVPTGGGAGSAQFSGAGYFKTTNKLDLTGYKDVTISWSTKSSWPSTNVAFVEQDVSQHGGFLADFEGGWTDHGFAELKNDLGANDYSVIYPTYTAAGVWGTFAVKFDLQAATQADVVNVYQNGDLWAATTGKGPAPASFLNALLYIGARPDGSMNYAGLLDNVKIEGTPTPEPSAIMLLATGLLGLLAYAWRKRK